LSFPYLCQNVVEMSEGTYRIIVVDDNPRIHDDFRKIFRKSEEPGEFDQLKQELFGQISNSYKGHHYLLDFFLSGQQAQISVQDAVAAKKPYSVAFIDMRMPGWDGIQTTLKLWEVDPDIQVVICTAYMDHSWESIVQKLGEEHSFLILKKPFEVIEVKQLAQMLSSKWRVMHNERRTVSELESALKAKDIFMARVSHELRTPLHGIIGIIDLLKETEMDEQQLEFVHTINSCGENLDRIIDDILDYSALEGGRFNLQEDSLNLPEFFQTLQKQFRFETLSRGIDLWLNLDEALPHWVKADTTRLHQIFGNLLRNAFKFTEEGEVTLSVEVKSLTPETVVLGLEVADTGVGIHENYMKNLFVPFSQEENVNRRRFGGNGLGLAICKALVESMDGEIGVESEVGSGTRVFFTLKLDLCSDAMIASKQSEKSDLALENGSLALRKQIKILAVDDSHTNRKVIQKQLYWMGYQCLTAGGCDEAIELLGTHDFDFIFMDCQMPFVDGFETTKKIRKLFPDYHEIPIVALSANIDRSTKLHCEAVGMDGFVSKPARRVELQNKIGELLGQRQKPR